MRIDGSIKTVTSGVSSLDPKRDGGQYALICDNLRCDAYTGLTKRAALHFYTTIASGFISGIHVVLPFKNNNEQLWLYLTRTETRVFSNYGIEYNVITPVETGYFNTLSGKLSITHASTDDTLYVANTLVPIKKTSLIEEGTTHSMVVLLMAPLSFSTIEVIWEDSTGTRQEITYPVPDGMSEDIGTNTVAADIAALMDAAAPAADTVSVQGSTILYERADEQYADITATDGQRDAGIVALNDETYSINNLPKYAAVDSIITIRPDPTSDRGQFYMKATPYVLTDNAAEIYQQLRADMPVQLQPIASITAGVRTALGFQEEGWWNPTIMTPQIELGSITTAAWKGYVLTAIGSWGGVSNESAMFQWRVVQTTVTPSALTHVTIVAQTTGKVILDTPVVVVQGDAGEGRGAYWTASNPVYLGAWEDGVTYDIYDHKVEGIYGRLPEVEWKECSAPGESKQIDAATFPHTLTRTEGTSDFIMAPLIDGVEGINALRTREAGDDETNDFPDFIDRTVNDLGFFQNRLVLLAGDSVCLSITNKPYAWFRETATQQLDNDPISIKSSSKDAQRLNWIVTHNNDSLLFSNTAQYKLNGGVGMTSRNAALPQSSSYINTLWVKPLPHASDVIFATRYNTFFSGISKYTVDQAADSQDIAHQLTLHTQQYLFGEVTSLVASTTTDMIFVLCVTFPNILYVNHSSQSKTPQNSWSKWIFPIDFAIEAMEMIQDRLMIVGTTTTGFTPGKHLQIFEILLNEIGFTAFTDPTVFMPALFVDYRHLTLEVNNLLVVPDEYPIELVTQENFVIMQSAGCPNPGEEVTGWVRWPDEPVFIIPDDLEGGEVWYGFRYNSLYVPSRPWIRDDSGVAQTASQFRITDYNFHAYGNEIRVEILNAPETWPDQHFNGVEGNLRSTEHRASFKQRHNEADIAFNHNGYDYFNLIQVEWRGTYIKVGRRF